MMSRALSSPTEMRTMPGVMPAASRSSSLSLPWIGAAGVDREGAHVADVRHLAHQLEAVEEGARRIHPTVQLDRHERTGARGRYRCSELAELVARQPGVPHLGNGGMCGERLRRRPACALATCRSIRSDRVSMPCSSRNVLDGGTRRPVLQHDDRSQPSEVGARAEPLGHRVPHLAAAAR